MLRVQIAIEAVNDDAEGGFRRAKEAGFTAVAVQLAGGTGGSGQAARQEGLTLAAVVATDSGADEPSVGGRDAAIQAWRERIEQARAAGAHLLISPLEYLGSAARFDERLRLAMEGLRGLRFDAERCGVRLAVRLGAGLDGWAAGTVREFIDGVNSHWVGCEVTLTDSRSLEALSILTHRVAAIRMEEPGAWMPADRAALAAVLREVDFDGVVLVADARGAEWIREAVLAGGGD